METKQAKWSQFLAQHGIRYKWKGTWPAIPVAIRAGESPYRTTAKKVPLISVSYEKGEIIRKNQIIEWPPDAPPAWVEKIHWRLLEEILPFWKGKSLDFFDAALYGYNFSAFQRERTERQGSPLPETDEEDHQALLKQFDAALDVCRQRVTEVVAGWKLEEVADYLEGFAYGIKCQQREEGCTPSASSVAMLSCKTLLRQQHAIKTMISRGATAREISELIAKHAVKSSGMTYAEYFNKHPDSEIKETFLKNCQKTFERVKLPLPRPGAPGATRSNYDKE